MLRLTAPGFLVDFFLAAAAAVNVHIADKPARRRHLKGLRSSLSARRLSCENCLARKIPAWRLITFCSGFPENFFSRQRLLFNGDDIVPALLAICSCTSASFNSPTGC